MITFFERILDIKLNACEFLLRELRGCLSSGSFGGVDVEFHNLPLLLDLFKYFLHILRFGQFQILFFVTCRIKSRIKVKELGKIWKTRDAPQFSRASSIFFLR